jgi:hypothetical protein
MSFQAYLTNIEAKTGKGPAQFRDWAAAHGWMADGLLRPEVKAGTVTAALKEEFGLGHGHAMAIYALLKGMKREGDA